MENNKKEYLDAYEVCTYYKERYEEAKTSYRRLEDKVNYLLAALAMEVSVIIAICGIITNSSARLEGVWGFLLLSSALSCFLFVILASFFLVKSWRLVSVPRMPAPSEGKMHNAMLRNWDKVDACRAFIVLYSKVIKKIDKIHEIKACAVENLFKALSLSYVFLIISILLIALRKL
ncbi:hypothetical protein ACSJL4_001969 [Serratia nematodiphila]|nr:hypothetical protein SMKC034_12650 [Serratia marcescens]